MNTRQINSVEIVNLEARAWLVISFSVVEPSIFPRLALSLQSLSVDVLFDCGMQVWAHGERNRADDKDGQHNPAAQFHTE